MRVSLDRLGGRASGAVAGATLWTLITRVSGFARIVFVGAILGPTFVANVYQAGSTLPNQIFTFLTGSLFVSILVPVIVASLDEGDVRRVEIVVGQFLGLALMVFAVISIALICSAAVIVELLSPSGTASFEFSLLIALLVPQIMFYAVVGVCSAVQTATNRVAFPAGAPLIENVLTIATLVLFALVHAGGPVTFGEVLILGIGSTVAVGAHAFIHVLRTRAIGFSIRPRLPRLDPELRSIYAVAGPSMAGAAAQASRTMFFVYVAATVPGGVVALQLALNFYSIVEALIARPLGQVALPSLSRAVRISGQRAYGAQLVRLVARCCRIAIPVGVGLIVFAPLLAQLVALGRMSGPRGVDLVGSAIVGVAPGAAIQCVVFLLTTALYAARRVARTVAASVTRTVLAVVSGIVALNIVPGSLLALGLILSATDAIALIVLVAGVSRWFSVYRRWFLAHMSATVIGSVLAAVVGLMVIGLVVSLSLALALQLAIAGLAAVVTYAVAVLAFSRLRRRIMRAAGSRAALRRPTADP